MKIKNIWCRLGVCLHQHNLVQYAYAWVMTVNSHGHHPGHGLF